MSEIEPKPFLHRNAGSKDKPRLVGIPCEVYSRIVGYLRPIQQWNVGKRQEYKERKAYDIDSILDV